MTRKPRRIPVPANETERLAALHRYKILDTPPEAAFDRITRLAARIFDMPTALISLVDESRAWLKSAIGFDASEVPRDAALCSFALLTDELLIVPDTQQDERFACNPLVQSEPGVRFYAGAPLLTHDGFNLGTLCLLDSQPREPLTAEQQATLVDLAAMVMDELALKLAIHQSVRSEEKYRSLFESLGEGFCICEMLFDENGQAHDYRLLEVNPAFENQTGLKQATGKTARELIPDLEAHWFEAFGKVVQTGEPTRFEQQSIAMDRWFDVNAFCIDEPQSHQFAILFTDTTERKHREAQLHRAASMDVFRLKLSDALRLLSDPIKIQSAAMRVLGEHLEVDRATYAEITPDGETVIINDNYVRDGVAKLVGNFPIAAYGSILDQMRIGQTMVYSDIETEAGLTEAEKARHKAAGAVANISVPLVKGRRWISALGVHCAKPRHWTGEEIALVQETAERTWAAVERARAEANLRTSETRYRLLTEAIPQLVWMTDAEGHVEYVNRQFCDYTGLTQAEMAGLGWLSILHPDDLEMTRQIWLSAVSSGQFYKIEYRFRRADGVYRWFLGHGIPLKDEQGQIQKWFGTCTDIEPQKQIEQTRLLLLEQETAARKQAEDANRTKDEFLAVLSHELRSPLNPILGWTQLLQKGNLDKTRQREALVTIERNTRLQTQLIDDLLDIARIMQGKLSLTVVPTSLTFVITAAIETVRLAAEAKNIQILLDLATEVVIVSGDAARLQQVVWNLLTNAIKFTPGGEQVTVELRWVDGSAQIRVVDTGKGISADFLPHIFEYFRQADSTTTRKFGGLGLGLAIVRQIVEAHGGTVWAESEGENRGATFTVLLPLSLQASAKAPELPCDSVTTEAPLRNLQILLVDDETDTRDFEAFVLEQSGANVTAVASGFEALQVLDRFVPDVLVSDIGMAEMDGYMLIRQIRARPAQEGGMIRAIALTAYARDSDRQKALEAGFQAHLTKPIEPQVLVEAISVLLL